jgi:predicted nicotinamide N-methyase
VPPARQRKSDPSPLFCDIAPQHFEVRRPVPFDPVDQVRMTLVSRTPSDTSGAQWSRLRQRLASRFDLVERQFEFGDITIDLTIVRNPDSVLDMVCDLNDRRERAAGKRLHDDELHLPYWAELWDSAIGVAQYLAAAGFELATPSDVLDLGCGMGLTGALLARLGHRVLMGDIEHDALLFARLNAQPLGATVRKLDWRRDRLHRSFDLIVGADVLYDKSQWTYLDAFWRHHLRDEGRVLLGEPGRQSGELFVPWIQDRGWSLTERSQELSTRPIRIFTLSLR